MNCTAGAAGYIDRLIFGNHTYSRITNSIYGQILRYDPEGILFIYVYKKIVCI